MTYANVTLLNLCIIIAAAIMFFVGLALMLLDKEKHQRKSKLLRNIAITIALLSQVISVILIAFKTGEI